MDMKKSLLNHAEAAQRSAEDSENAAAHCEKQAAEYRLSAEERRKVASEYRRLAATYDVVDAEFDPDFKEVKDADFDSGIDELGFPKPRPCQYRVYVDGVEVHNWESFSERGVFAYIMDKGEKVLAPTGFPALERISGRVKVVKEAS
ncbi:MAG: hypothetical protein V4641_16215 [Pseudomonadota bacterium]